MARPLAAESDELQASAGARCLADVSPRSGFRDLAVLGGVVRASLTFMSPGPSPSADPATRLRSFTDRRPATAKCLVQGGSRRQGESRKDASSQVRCPRGDARDAAQARAVHVDHPGPGRAEQSLAEHRAIVDAVAKGDPDAAEQAIRAHLAHVVQSLRRGRPTASVV